METKMILGVVLCAVVVFIIGALIKKSGDGNKQKEFVHLSVDPQGKFRDYSWVSKLNISELSDNKRFGRFKVTFGDGTKKTLVGNLATILEVNNVESFYEIK